MTLSTEEGSRQMFVNHEILDSYLRKSREDTYAEPESNLTDGTPDEHMVFRNKKIDDILI